MSAGPSLPGGGLPAAPALWLHSGDLRLALRPDLGAAIAGLWLDDLPVLHSTAPADLASPRPSGGFVLAPYSNRLGFRRFSWHGRPCTTAANTPGSPHSMHGVAWARPWAVAAASASRADLVLAHAADADWPFAFQLHQRLHLRHDVLRIELAFTNTHPQAQPVGLGWHPFFHRRPGSRLRANVGHRWARDEASGLPLDRQPHPPLDDAVSALALDHCFDGWLGPARIDDGQLSMVLTASVGRLVVHTPAHLPYFCAEPVGHVNNAVQMADPLAHGLTDLAPGATLSAWFELAVARARIPDTPT